MSATGLSILNAIQGWRTPWLDRLMVALTSLGEYGAMWIALALVLLVYKPTRRQGLAIAAALLLSLLLCNLLLKPLIARPRPFTLAAVELLIPQPTDWSFPSGHACSSFAAAGALCARERPWTWVFLAVAMAIAFSRLYLYVHFPGDVIAGLLLGLLCAAAARKMIAKLK